MSAASFERINSFQFPQSRIHSQRINSISPISKICFSDGAEYVDPDPGYSFEDVAKQITIRVTPPASSTSVDSIRASFSTSASSEFVGWKRETETSPGIGFMEWKLCSLQKLEHESVAESTLSESTRISRRRRPQSESF